MKERVSYYFAKPFSPDREKSKALKRTFFKLTNWKTGGGSHFSWSLLWAFQTNLFLRNLPGLTSECRAGIALSTFSIFPNDKKCTRRIADSANLIHSLPQIVGSPRSFGHRRDWVAASSAKIVRWAGNPRHQRCPPERYRGCQAALIIFYTPNSER